MICQEETERGLLLTPEVDGMEAGEARVEQVDRV